MTSPHLPAAQVLKILQHLCTPGSHHFLSELCRNATLVQEVTVFSGPPGPVHGITLHQRVRAAAQELASVLFSDSVLPPPALSPCKASPPTGMGSWMGLNSGMQGFGYSPGRNVSTEGTVLDRIHKTANVVANVILPPSELASSCLHDNYQPVMAPSAAVEASVHLSGTPLPSHSMKVAYLLPPPPSQRCPALAGGGWEESDSGHSSQNSSLENGDLSRASVGGSCKSGTDSQSGASRESVALSERVEAMQLGDCAQEMMLINTLSQGSKVFLSRDETQHFIKECAILNCEAVVELLSRKLQDSPDTVSMRCLCALACLMSSDLLSLDWIFAVTQKPLLQLSEGSAGPVANKATKLLRQFEALIAGGRLNSSTSSSFLPAMRPQLLDGAPDVPSCSSLIHPLFQIQGQKQTARSHKLGQHHTVPAWKQTHVATPATWSDSKTLV
ncbi:LOW QUALITY PROTEIN: AP-4 complex accessory subunit Tepsin-like [Polyodon spathula]|uniref:LOW QUALITY PROTEIN: AP-4 complex accessory subunit Tepsin-like n=1 Tax=Polyodon spathula TaxID=7913 RepID=UPI001B7DB9D6|nr:LOW QUALITY PROTEIN: AP-4 complex accessory subunit Tepsin-like [Polyodon spathula]